MNYYTAARGRAGVSEKPRAGELVVPALMVAEMAE